MPRRLHDRWNAVSLRSKITGVTVLVLTLGLLVSGAGTSIMLKRVLVNQLDAQLQSVASSTTNLNVLLGDRSNASESTPTEVFIEIFDGTGSGVYRNWETRKAGDLPDFASMNLSKAFEYSSRNQIFTLENASGTGEFHAVTKISTFRSDTQSDFTGYAVIAMSTDRIETVMGYFIAIFFGFGILVIFVGAILTRLLVTSTFQPLREVEQTAAAIADGDFSQRLSGATPNTEVGRLNRSLNTMLNRIDGAFRDRARTIEQMRRFVGDASHELRTPLVSVRGYAELYRMGALPDEEAVRQAMERIEKEAIRMGGLVENLLELARLDETKPLELTEVDLVPLARDAALDANAANPGRSVTVAIELPNMLPPESSDQPGDGATLRDDQVLDAVTDDLAATLPPGATGPIAFAGARLARLRGRRLRRDGLEGAAPVETGADAPGTATVVPAIVLAEENKLRQVLANLIGNAVRYTPENSPIEIGVTVSPVEERAVLEVRDHGDGVPPEIREKIFQRFWRADTSRTRETGGSGLGLAIVSSIVAAHRGTVEVDETAGGGATFRLTLPLSPSVAVRRSGVASDRPATAAETGAQPDAEPRADGLEDHQDPPGDAEHVANTASRR